MLELPAARSRRRPPSRGPRSATRRRSMSTARNATVARSFAGPAGACHADSSPLSSHPTEHFRIGRGWSPEPAGSLPALRRRAGGPRFGICREEPYEGASRARRRRSALGPAPCGTTRRVERAPAPARARARRGRESREQPGRRAGNVKPAGIAPDGPHVVLSHPASSGPGDVRQPSRRRIDEQARNPRRLRAARRHARGLQRHLEEIGLRGEASAARTLLDLIPGSGE